EQRIVRPRPLVANGAMVARRAHAVREEGDDELGVGVDPHARAGETEVAERPRPEAGAGARALGALAVEASAQGASGARTDEPFEGRGPPIAEDAAAREPVENGRTERHDGGDGAEDPGVPGPAKPRQRPGVLVVHGAHDDSAAPGHVLGRRERAFDAARRETADRARLPGETEGLQHEALDRLAGVACPGRARDPLAGEGIPEITVDGLEAVGAGVTWVAGRVRPPRSGGLAKSGGAVHGLAAHERSVERAA